LGHDGPPHGVLVQPCRCATFQNGGPFRIPLRIQGALDSVAGGIASVGAAIAEIDRLRVDNGTLARRERAAHVENARLQEIARENEQLDRTCSSSGPTFGYQTAAASVISRDSSEFRRVSASTRVEGRHQGRDVVGRRRRRLAGRVTSVGPDSASVVLLTDGTSTVIGQMSRTRAQAR
jgi:cell shape-determining protein MreC